MIIRIRSTQIGDWSEVRDETGRLIYEGHEGWSPLVEALVRELTDRPTEVAYDLEAE